MKKSYIEFIFLFVIGIIFLVLASQNLVLPGVEFDEVLKATVAMDIVHGRDTGLNSLKLYGKNFFIMMNPYDGPVEVYSFIPFYYLSGINLYSMRMSKIFWGLVEVILFFYFAKAFFNKKVAYIATTMFATMPTVIFYSRQGAFVNHLILIPLFFSFISFLKFLKQNKINYFYLGSFFFGIGFTTKLTFWWLILPILLSVYLFKIRLKINLWQAFLSLSSFCLGAAPIILYNLAFKGYTFKYILTSSPETNVHIFSNLILRFKQFILLLNGGLSDFSFGDTFSTYFFIFFSIAFIFIFFYSLKIKNPKLNKTLFFIIFLIITVLLQSIFTVSQLREMHLFILVPFSLLIASYFLHILFNKKKIIFFILFSLIIFSNILIVFQYYDTLKKTGGIGRMSDAIYDLAEYLEQNRIRYPLAVDWGFTSTIRLITKDQVIPLEIFVPPDRGKDELKIFQKICYEKFKNPNNIYIFPVSAYAQFKRFDAFKKIAEEMNKKVVLEKIFYQRNGEPIYLLYRVLDS